MPTSQVEASPTNNYWLLSNTIITNNNNGLIMITTKMYNKKKTIWQHMFLHETIWQQMWKNSPPHLVSQGGPVFRRSSNFSTFSYCPFITARWSSGSLVRSSCFLNFCVSIPCRHWKRFLYAFWNQKTRSGGMFPIFLKQNPTTGAPHHLPPRKNARYFIITRHAHII